MLMQMLYAQLAMAIKRKVGKISKTKAKGKGT